ncbi:MAG TPA: hypothetical protein PLO33_08565 [Kouleothrix sp.]|nr:hypothetical protein [Kouleothrix sp.]HRC75718.1 hypothetical protein [Kouleothrix sp.]
MRDIAIGDEVYSYKYQLFARVEEVFPAAVCVKVALLTFKQRVEMLVSPQLWRADEIANLSVCRYCGEREKLVEQNHTGIPLRVCERCCVVPPESEVHELGLWW